MILGVQMSVLLHQAAAKVLTLLFSFSWRFVHAWTFEAWDSVDPKDSKTRQVQHGCKRVLVSFLPLPMSTPFSGVSTMRKCDEEFAGGSQNGKKRISVMTFGWQQKWPCGRRQDVTVRLFQKKRCQSGRLELNSFLLWGPEVVSLSSLRSSTWTRIT